jgi:hypothetical protein
MAQTANCGSPPARFGAKNPPRRRRRNRSMPMTELGPPPEAYPELPWDGALVQTIQWYRAMDVDELGVYTRAEIRRIVPSRGRCSRRLGPARP